MTPVGGGGTCQPFWDRTTCDSLCPATLSLVAVRCRGGPLGSITSELIFFFCVWWWWRVDPGGGWELGGRGDLPDEPFGIVEVGVEEHIGAVLAQRLGAVVVDVCGGVVADTEDHPHILTSGRTLGQKPRASSIEPNRSGNVGWYFRVLNWASL